MDSLEQDPLLNLNKAMSLFLYGFLTGFGFSTGCTHGHSHKIITLPLKKKTSIHAQSDRYFRNFQFLKY